jgi:hypothetical protein
MKVAFLIVCGALATVLSNGKAEEQAEESSSLGGG